MRGDLSLGRGTKGDIKSNRSWGVRRSLRRQRVGEGNVHLSVGGGIGADEAPREG